MEDPKEAQCALKPPSLALGVEDRCSKACKLEGSRKFSPACRRLFYEFFAEFWGTLIIVVGGVGSVNSAIVVGAHGDLWHIAMMWGFSVSLAIYCTASVSGAHLNPAVSFALAIFKGFPWRKLPLYWLAQMLGGIVGGAINLLVFYTYIERMEKQNNLTRGEEGSQRVAMVFGEYYPDPNWVSGNVAEGENGDHMISTFGAFCVEAWGTAILMFVILAVTDSKQKVLVQKEMAPFFIGFTVSVLIGLYAPLTQAGWNPARDFGPRVVAALAGWGEMAIPGPRSGFWLYIIGPMVGAPLGAVAYVTTVEPGLRLVAEAEQDE